MVAQFYAAPHDAQKGMTPTPICTSSPPPVINDPNELLGDYYRKIQRIICFMKMMKNYPN